MAGQQGAPGGWEAAVAPAPRPAHPMPDYVSVEEILSEGVQSVLVRHSVTIVKDTGVKILKIVNMNISFMIL